MISLSLTEDHKLLITLPGPGGSSRTKEVASFGLNASLQSNDAELASVMRDVLRYLEAQRRAGEIKPWLDDTKAQAEVQRLAPRGKARPQREAPSLAARVKLGVDVSLEDLGL